MVDTARLGEARWTKANTWMFVSFALGLLLENYVFGLASIAVFWVHEPKALSELLLAWAPIWLVVGIAAAGPAADRLGRKVTLYLTLALYGLGGILLFFSYNYVILLISLALMLMAGGGEMNSIMVATHELMPRRHRGKAMMLIVNAINLGGLILGLLALTSAGGTIGFQRDVVAAAVVIVVVALLVARINMPESVLWLQKKGRHEEALRQVKAYWGANWEAETTPEPPAPVVEAAGKKNSLFFRLLVMILIAAANTVGFGLVAYTFAFHYFPNIQPLILVVFEGVGFVAGFFGFLGDRLSRRHLLFWSFVGTLVFTVLIGTTTGAWTKSMPLFWILLIALAIFNSICYLTEDTVKAEVWPTAQRGTLTAVARVISIAVYIPAIYLTSNLSVHSYFIFNSVVWLIGTLAAGAWLLWGRETGQGLSIEVASGEA